MSQAKLYRIRNWSSIYENNRTREMKSMGWLPLPVKLDGDGYSLLMEDADGPAMFGCFIAILEVAARCDPRGVLVRAAGIPHDAASLARLTRMPRDIVEKTLGVCSNDPKWLDFEAKTANCGKGAGLPQADRRQTAGGCEIPASELNRTELNRTEEKDGDRKFPSPLKLKFTKPSYEDVMLYCKERQNEVDPNKFLDFYESKGWRIGNQKMRDWKAAVRTWERRSGKSGSFYTPI